MAASIITAASKDLIFFITINSVSDTDFSLSYCNNLINACTDALSIIKVTPMELLMQCCPKHSYGTPFSESSSCANAYPSILYYTYFSEFVKHFNYFDKNSHREKTICNTQAKKAISKWPPIRKTACAQILFPVPAAQVPDTLLSGNHITRSSQEPKQA
ncbi:MAG: hypothetical protein IKN55_06085 [Oscillospiraceae bacterium]|nr:hypothetical protein [Oscillospiraceae bacterium]